MSETQRQIEVISESNGTKFYKVNFQIYSLRLLTDKEYEEIDEIISKLIGDLKL